jgi:hypothetical protein
MMIHLAAFLLAVAPSEVEDGLWIGGEVASPPPGVQAVLNLCGSKDAYAKAVEFYEMASIPDAAPAPSADWLYERVKFIDRNRQAGRAVFVHCAAGNSRAPFVVAAYLMARDGSTRDDALAAIRKTRPEIHPNMAFMARLLEWEKEWKR